MIGAKLSDQRNSKHAGRFKSPYSAATSRDSLPRFKTKPSVLWSCVRSKRGWTSPFALMYQTNDFCQELAGLWKRTRASEVGQKQCKYVTREGKRVGIVLGPGKGQSPSDGSEVEGLSGTGLKDGVGEIWLNRISKVNIQTGWGKLEKALILRILLTVSSVSCFSVCWKTIA